MKISTTGNAETTQRDIPIRVREMLLPPKLREFRQKLNAKAKQEPKYRFYSLYGHIIKTETLKAAWQQVRANNGAPGVDGVSIGQIERSEESLANFLVQLEADLRTRRYRPMPVRRVHIPKPDGRTRPLGIPTLRDRVVQTAALLVLEPIFEADFLECSHGFRPGRGARDALRVVKENLQDGRTEVYDADLKGYFDTIPHAKLMLCVGKRVVDGSVLALIRAWLRAPVEEPPARKGGPKAPVKRPREGTPQGGVISPMLANLYLHWFDKAFHAPGGPAHFARATLVRYADDFVILARHMGKRITEWTEDKLENWLGLTINRDKTRVIKATQAGATVDFLGYSHRQESDLHGRTRRWWRQYPSAKTMAKQREWLRQNINAGNSHEPLGELISRVNEHHRGWKAYFRLGHPRREHRQLNHWTIKRLAGHLKRRSQRGYRQPEGMSVQGHLQNMGLEPL